jgi:hypothetical protein
MDAALSALRASGWSVCDEDIARLSPLGFCHINFLGRYTFSYLELGALRQLRDPISARDADSAEDWRDAQPMRCDAGERTRLRTPRSPTPQGNHRHASP